MADEDEYLKHADKCRFLAECSSYRRCLLAVARSELALLAQAVEASD